MNNLELYNKCFEKVFKTTNFFDLKYKDFDLWDSVGHITLIAEIEEVFNLSLEPEDMMSFLSYKEGLEILKENYSIVF